MHKNKYNNLSPNRKTLLNIDYNYFCSKMECEKKGDLDCSGIFT